MAEVPNVAVLDLPAGGYEDHLFLDLPPESRAPHCPVCLLVVREPHVLLCCGSRICQVSNLTNSYITLVIWHATLQSIIHKM